ncbi:MAG: hypothetical protein HFE62_03755 [Firmicutes bacterium]|nr:hypothetical protein [Bacillota bacterium]
MFGLKGCFDGPNDLSKKAAVSPWPALVSTVGVKVMNVLCVCAFVTLLGISLKLGIEPMYAPDIRR